MQNDPIDKLLPLHIAAKRLNRDAKTLRGMCRERRIAFTLDTISGRYYIRESTIAAVYVDVKPDKPTKLVD